MIIDKRQHENLTILDVKGAIQLGESAQAFSQTLENVLRAEGTNVVIDFTGINYIDSTGVGELIGYLSKFSAKERQVMLVNPSERVRKLLKLAHLDPIFKIFPDEGSAVAYLQSRESA